MGLTTNAIWALIDTLDDPNNRKGDDAACELAASRCFSQVIEALLTKRLHTAKGRLRATNVLERFGKEVPQALEAYVATLSDKSYHVAHNALFAVVFWQDKSLLPIIDAHLSSCTSDKMRKAFRLAKKALEKENPFLFSPYFHDVDNVWRLDPKRFRKHIGPL